MTYRRLAPWQVVSRRTLVERHWMIVHEDHIKLENGREISEFHVVEQPSWAAVLCHTVDDQIVLVRQYRHGVGKESLELSAGVIEEGEAPLAAAKRELREETGYTAQRWEHVATFACEPSRQTVHAHFYAALGAVAGAERALDESEDIDVVRVPRSELGKLLDRGDIIHGVHVGAILLAARRGLITL